MNKIELSAVSYLNARPFLNGLEHHPVRNQINLSLDVPSVIASKLKTNEVQIGLVPVAAIQSIKNAHIISDYCIGALNKVETVCLYSHVPITEVENILLDYQSETSVNLLKVLMKHYWKQTVNYFPTTSGYELKINQTTAGLVIGDRNFGMQNQFPYCYDLSEAWFSFTSLPFIFACWVSTIQLPDDFILQFNVALKQGVENILQVCHEAAGNYPGVDVHHYLNNCIHYKRTDDMMNGYKKFIELMNEL